MIEGMKKIGVIGSASVGQTLAEGFKTHGYEVRIASRTPAKLSEFSTSSGIPSGTFADVAAWAEAAVLAVSGSINAVKHLQAVASEAPLAKLASSWRFS